MRMEVSFRKNGMFTPRSTLCSIASQSLLNQLLNASNNILRSSKDAALEIATIVSRKSAKVLHDTFELQYSACVNRRFEIVAHV